MEAALAHGPAVLLSQIEREVLKLGHGDFGRILHDDSVEPAVEGVAAVRYGALAVFKNNRFAHVINTRGAD